MRVLKAVALALLMQTVNANIAPAAPCGRYAPYKIQRPVPNPPVPAATYVSQGAGHMNWGGGLCMDGFRNNATTCRQHCDADPTCIGYETGDAAAERFHEAHCCLEFCSPPGTGDGNECDCWVSGTVPDGWNARDPEAEAQAWTYHHKIAAGTMDFGSGIGAGDSVSSAGNTCTQRACSDFAEDCCTRPEVGSGESQTCSRTGLYPVSVGWCGGDGGHYTCCPYGVSPTASQLGDHMQKCEATATLYTNGDCYDADSCEPYRNELCDGGACQEFYNWANEGGHQAWCGAPAAAAIGIVILLVIVIIAAGVTVTICCCCPGCPCYQGKKMPPPTYTPPQPAVQMMQPSATAVAMPMAVATPMATVAHVPMATAVAVPMS